MSTKNFIELNGKRYDATSGKLLGDASTKGNPHGQVISDIASAPPKPAAKANSVLKPQPRTTSHLKAKHAAAHRPQRAKTLMRSSVKKPSLHSEPKPHVQTLAGHIPALRSARPKMLTRTLANDSRLARAASTPKSQLVNHFSVKRPSILPKSTPSPAASHSSAKPAEAASGSLTDILPPKADRLAPHVHSAKSRTNALLVAGLAKADSHRQPPVNPKAKKRKPRRWLRRASWTGLVIIIIAGLGILLNYNLPGLEVRFASIRSGVHAELPTKIPTHFALKGSVVYRHNEVKLTYGSVTTGQTFQLVQQASSWDSNTLQDSFVAEQTSSYHIVQDDGQLIYIYGQGNATWVNGGVWYVISGNARLSTSQLTAIATSL